MVKSRKTRRATRKAKSSILTIPQLRKAFDHMDTVVESIRKLAKQSFSDAVIMYRNEWHKTFKRDLSPADASAYLKFRFDIKSSKTRRARTRGGGVSLAGAPLDYSLRPGVNGVYGNFPSYQQEGLDRYYASAISSDCGKPNGFPTDGSSASAEQLGGGLFDGLRAIASSAPPTELYKGQMGVLGTPPYPVADPTSNPALRSMPANYITPANLTPHIRSHGQDVYKTS